MAKFNPVPSEVLHSALENAGFTKSLSGKEVVYDLRNHHNPSLSVRVFTSSKVGAGKVVSCGKDAIRASLVYTNSSGNTNGTKLKFSRVNRVGTTEAIVGRMLDLAREVYRAANHIAAVGPCKCGAPRYEDTKACMAFCWKKKDSAASNTLDHPHVA